MSKSKTKYVNKWIKKYHKYNNKNEREITQNMFYAYCSSIFMFVVKTNKPLNYVKQCLRIV